MCNGICIPTPTSRSVIAVVIVVSSGNRVFYFNSVELLNQHTMGSTSRKLSVIATFVRLPASQLPALSSRLAATSSQQCNQSAHSKASGSVKFLNVILEMHSKAVRNHLSVKYFVTRTGAFFSVTQVVRGNILMSISTHATYMNFMWIFYRAR